jgi:hypothetical protein
LILRFEESDHLVWFTTVCETEGEYALALSVYAPVMGYFTAYSLGGALDEKIDRMIEENDVEY